MKKIISVILATAMLFMSSVGTFANQVESSQINVAGQEMTVTILKDTATERVVKVVSENEISISTVNKVTGETNLTTNGQIVGLNNNEKSSTISNLELQKNSNLVSLNSIGRKETIDQLQTGDHSYAVKRAWNSSNSNYLYYWDCGIKNTKVYDKLQTSSNEGHLNDFRDKVNAIQLKKIEIAASFGAGTLSVIGACLAGAPETMGATAVIALIVAAGASLAAAYLGAELYFAQRDADYLFRTM